jgi:Protein prenyltransferase alpha subunit repeat
VVATFDRWEQEWPYVEGLLQEDGRNNSAWAQRAFLLAHRLRTRLRALAATGSAARSACAAADKSSARGTSAGRSGKGEDDHAAFLRDALAQEAEGGDRGMASSGGQGGPLEECMRAEVAFVSASARRMPRNESAWNYLCGLQHVLLVELAQLRESSGAADRADADADACSLLSGSGAARDGDSGVRGGAGAPLHGQVQESAQRFLATCAPGVRDAADAALAVAARAMFAVPIDVLALDEGSVPARATLLRAYAAAAMREKDDAERRRAAEAARLLASSLCELDPIRKEWSLKLSNVCAA